MMLITGHCGFIGSKLKKEFPQAIGIDLREGRNLLTCALPQNVEVIYHLAAQSDVVASFNDPLHDLDNIRITARLVKQYPNAKIIHANSCASEYKASPYGFSKAASAEYLKIFHKNVVDCVFPNIYGPGSRSVVDVFKSQDDVIIYGDGLQTRDFVHIDDIVRGLVLAKDWEPGTYHMGSGTSTTILELAEGKLVRFLPERIEPKEVVVKNTTPNWKPTINVLEYVRN